MGDCWIIEKGEYRQCSRPAAELASLASFHNHSVYSREDLAPLNTVMALPFMRPLRRLVQHSFGLSGVRPLDYADVQYHPPLAPQKVWEVESTAGRKLGVDCVNVAVSDHDEIAGSLELHHAFPERTAIAEELTLRCEDYLFHIGVVGLPESDCWALHERLQSASRGGRLDELFETLHSTGCVVILNHPMLPWAGCDPSAPVAGLLKRYGWAIDALEWNGMRDKEENDAVVQLAGQWNKPLVGGGDTHSPVPSPALCASRSAKNMRDFLQEIKAGEAVTVLKQEYFRNRNWKLFLRVINFISMYREIAKFRGQPVQDVVSSFVLLDGLRWPFRLFLKMTSALGLYC